MLTGALFALVFASPAAHAEVETATAAAETVYVVKPIIVEARRNDPRMRLFDATGFVAIVDLRERKNRVEDLSHVLSQLVGVRVKQYGGLGSFATVSIRGSSANQVAIFVDGVPVGDPYLGVTNLADLPIGAVQRIEVFRGISPSRFGSAGIGGAVNLITRDESVWNTTDRVAKLEARTSAGSFGTRRHQGSLWAQYRFARFFTHASVTDSDGDFSFLDDNGTPINVVDNERVYRVNNDLNAWNAFTRIELVRRTLGTVAISQEYFEREQGVPGIGSFQSVAARGKRQRRLTHLRVEGEPFLRRSVTVNAMGFYSKSIERFYNPGDGVSLVKQDTDNTILAYGGRAGARWIVPVVPLALEANFEGRKEQFHPVDRVPTLREGPDRWRHTNTLSLASELYLLRDRLILSGVQRITRTKNEYYDPPRFPWLPAQPRGRIAREYRSPSAGARFHVTSWLMVKGNVGRYYRLPTFLELFGNTGSVTGNMDLVPEAGINRDIGFVVMFARAGRFENTFAEVSYLDNKVDDLILYFPNSQYTSKPTNIASARIRGWEFVGSTTWAGVLDFSASYALLDTKDTSDIPYLVGNVLPSRPRDTVALSTGFRWSSWRASWEYHYIGANYLDPANFTEVPGRSLHNLILESRFPAGLSLTIELRNVTDNQVSDIAGYPLPGRLFYSTLAYRLTKENN